MKSRTKAVVIGGGIAGCSTLYHLTKEGWTDVVLLERNNLTSGTTWHSAAQVTNFGMNQTMVGLKKHSIELYRDLARSLYNSIECFFKPTIVWFIPKLVTCAAECQVVPLVKLFLSSKTTSVHPSFVR